MQNNLRERVVAKLQSASNTELEKFIFKYSRRDVNVNFVTRTAVEALFLKEIEKYSDQEIENFLNQLT